MLPLLQYHKDQHKVADPLIADIFYAESHAAAATELDERLERITIINLETRLFNKLNNIEADTGVIDIDIFLYAWRVASLGPYLRDFCRLHHYPIEWARQPPETGYTYQPYEHRYWEADDWSLGWNQPSRGSGGGSWRGLCNRVTTVHSFAGPIRIGQS
jgi:hypothetical protein